MKIKEVSWLNHPTVLHLKLLYVPKRPLCLHWGG